MAGQLFQTDGFRGPVDHSMEPGKINGPTFERLANTFAATAIEDTGTPHPLFVVGRDSRPSGPELSAAVVAGATAAGAEVWDIGVAPTPVTSWVARRYGGYAVMLTASHNPEGDDGFKGFDPSGNKLSRDKLDTIEERYWSGLEGSARSESGGSVVYRPELTEEYLDARVTALGGPDVLKGKLMIVDGANGAAWDLAPRLYRALGAGVVTVACEPEGRINDGYGAAHLEGLTSFQDSYLSEHPELIDNPRFLGGFAHDGDADRVMGVDQAGNVINGNHWMHFLAAGQTGIVGTLYTNSGLREALDKMGVEFDECGNGDSFVTKMLQELGPSYTRGGEPSGHLIDTADLPSGDGPAMAARMAIDLAQRGATLGDAHSSLPLWPELLRNVRVDGGDSKRIVESPALLEAKDTLSKAHDARVIMRASGTEPLVRVFAEAKSQDGVDATVRQLAEQVKTLADQR